MLANNFSGRLKSRPISGIERKFKPEMSGFTYYLEGKEVMKIYRNAVAALVLAIVFSTSVYAGEGILHTEKTPPPPPPAQSEGVMHTGIAAPAPEGDVLTETALSLLQNLLALL